MYLSFAVIESTVWNKGILQPLGQIQGATLCERGHFGENQHALLQMFWTSVRSNSNHLSQLNCGKCHQKHLLIVEDRAKPNQVRCGPP